VNRTTFGIRFVCAIAVSWAACTCAEAQQPNGSPFSGLFTGSPKEQPHHLDLSGSAFAAWDDNVLAQLPNASGGGTAGIGNGLLPSTVKPGIASGYQAAISYGFHRTGTRSAVSLGGNGSFQQFESSSSSKPLQFQSYDVAGSVRTSITNKVSASFSGGSAYAPFYQYAPFLKSTMSSDSPVGSDYGFAVNSQWVRSTSAGVSIDDRFTKKSVISGSANWTAQDIPSEDRRLETESAGMHFSHNLTRKFSFNVGYALQQTRSTQAGLTSDWFRYGNVDVGVGYGDGLTLRFARVYTLSMSVGASIAKNGDAASIVKTGKSTQLGVTGGATLSRPLGRSWDASISYTRGVSYMVGFVEPFNTDAASAGLGGPIVQRLFFSLGAGASRGQQVFSQDGTIIAYTGSARLTYGLFGNFGLYAQASYYNYSVPLSVLSSFNFMPQLQRRSVSAGVTTWLPLIKPPRVRRNPNDQQAGQQ